MVCEQILCRIAFVLGDMGKNRSKAEITENGILLVTLDLHGMTRREAKRIISNLIAVIQIAFVFKLIHA